MSSIIVPNINVTAESLSGNVTKKLISKVRNFLNDVKREIIPNDIIITEKLSDYQERFMRDYHTNKIDLEFELFKNQEYYEFDNFVGSVFSLKDKYKCPYRIEFSNNSSENYFRVLNYTSINDYDIVTFKVSIIPTENDLITLNNDPIILKEFNKFLVDAVLSDYMYINKNFKPLTFILEEVKQLSYKNNANNMTGKRIQTLW